MTNMKRYEALSALSPAGNATGAGAGGIALDPRVKLLQAIVLCGIVFMYESQTVIAALVGLLLLYARVQRVKLPSVAIVLLTTASAAVWAALVWIGAAPAALFVHYAIKFIPLSVMTLLVVRTVHVRELLLTLTALRLPRAVTLSLTVVFRCMPSIAQELRMIANAMRLRGIDASWRGLLLRPLRTAEWIVAPLLIRGLKLSDELAMAALTRGAEHPGQATSLRELRLGRAELAAALLTLAALLALWAAEAAGLAQWERGWLA